jgi:phosphoglycolate phosphatase-like HAD superfamily hydrolase
MAATQIAGHKRTRSSTEPEVVAAEATPKASGSATAAPKHVLIMHLNSLLDCKDAAISTIRDTLAEVFANRNLPEPTDEAILCAFCNSPIFFEILAHLGITDISQEEHDRVIEAYPRIYSLTGQPRIQKALGAVEFLEEVKRREDIALAVMSNDPQRAAELLGNLGMGELVETVRNSQSLYDSSRFSSHPARPIQSLYKQTSRSNASKQVLASTGAQAGSTGHLAYELFWDNWKKVVEPWLIAHHGNSTVMTEPTIAVTSPKAPNGDTDTTPGNTGPESKTDTNNIADETTEENTPAHIKPEQVMVVSCALYDLGMAKLAGMKTVWVKKIHLEDEAAMQAVKTHPFVVDNLQELHNLLFVGPNLEGGHEQLPFVSEASGEDEDQVMRSQDQAQAEAQTANEDRVIESQDQVHTETAEEGQATQSQEHARAQIQAVDKDQAAHCQDQA